MKSTTIESTVHCTFFYHRARALKRNATRCNVTLRTLIINYYCKASTALYLCKISTAAETTVGYLLTHTFYVVPVSAARRLNYRGKN